MEYRLSSPCRGSNSFDAIPLEEIELTPEHMISILRSAGFEIKLKSDVLVIGKKNSVEVALYRRGKLIIKHVSEKASADKIASDLFSLI